jgi:hypothetical protein
MDAFPLMARLQQGPKEGKRTVAVKLAKWNEMVNTGRGSGRTQGERKPTPGADQPKGCGGPVRQEQIGRLLWWRS